MAQRVSNGFASDLVKDETMKRNLGLEKLDQVPGNRLTLAVLVGGKQEFVRIRQNLFELAHFFLLVRRHDVKRLEIVIHIDPEPGPRLLLQVGRDLRRAIGEVADVTDARIDGIALAQEPGNGPGFGGRLDDDQTFRHEMDLQAGLRTLLPDQGEGLYRRSAHPWQAKPFVYIV